MHTHATHAALFLVCGFLLGIVARTFFPVEEEVLLGSLLVLFVGFLYWRFIVKNRHLLLVLLFLLGGTLGVFRLEAALSNDELDRLEYFFEKNISAVGVVDTEADVRSAHTNLTVSLNTIEGEPIDAKVLVRTERFPEFHYGDAVHIEGKLTKPEAFETDLGRTFDYPGYLGARDIYFVVPFGDVVLLDRGGGNSFIKGLLTLKGYFLENIEMALPEPSAGLAEGITLGVKRALGEDLETVFRRTGIIHIVVLSGYNVSIVAEAIMRLLTAFFLPRTRAIVGTIAIALFAIIAGLSATVLRASLMAGLILYARATGNTYSTMRALIFAGVVMLLVNPKLFMHDPGFQLSFLATFGLITLAPLIEKRLELVPTRFGVREFLTATLATQIFILPFLLFLIGEFSLVSVLVNVLVLPVVPLAMLGTFFVGVFGVLSDALASLFALPTFYLLTYIIKLSEFFGSLTYAAVSVPEFPFVVVIAAYAAITLFLYNHYKREYIRSLQ